MKIRILIILYLLFTASCLPSNTQLQQTGTSPPSMVPEPSLTLEPEITATTTMELDAVFDQIIKTAIVGLDMEIITPQVGYEEKIQSLINEQELSECSLPCWWGIVPGKSVWNDYAINLLRQVSGNISYQSTDEFLIASVTSPLLESTNTTVRTSYEVRDNVVTLIEVSRDYYGTTSKYQLEFVWTEFGEPDEIWLGPWEIDEEFGFPYWVYYKKRGVLLAYGGGSATIDKEDLVMCFENTKTPALILFPENYNQSFGDLLQSLHLFSPPPVSSATYYLFQDISSLTNMDFFNIALNEPPENCFVSKVSDWGP